MPPILGLTGYVEMMLENPENLFILANRGSDKVNLHRVVRTSPSLVFPGVWGGK
jgi:hypothetical protein